MKTLGINTIKHYGPGVYDRNILNAAGDIDIKIQYGFWIPGNINFADDSITLEKLTHKIINTIKDLKNNAAIISWNIGNTTFQNLTATYYKPVLFYQQQAYLAWLQKLIAKIKTEDGLRPVTIEVSASENLLQSVDILHNNVPGIAAYGIIVKDKDTAQTALLSQLNLPWFYSSISPKVYAMLPASQKTFFMQNWKDEAAVDMIRLDGLTDFAGRWKPELYNLAYKWKRIKLPAAFPEIKILRPVAATWPGAKLTYHAIIANNNRWNLAASSYPGLQFEWYLLQKDNHNSPLAISAVGTGAYVTVTIPEHPSSYQLYLYIIKDGQVKIVNTTLNTPLESAAVK